MSFGHDFSKEGRSRGGGRLPVELVGAAGNGRQCHCAVVDIIDDDRHTVLRDDAGTGAAGGVDFRDGERRARRAGERDV